MIVRVTESHIQRGRRCSSHSCPLAIAFFEATGEHWDIGSVVAILRKDGHRFHFPTWLVDWVTRYDNAEEAEPIEIDIGPYQGAGA